MPGHIVVTVGPVVRVLGTGPKERFAPTLEAVAITAGHEQRVSDGAAVADVALRTLLPMFVLREVLIVIIPGSLPVAHRKTDEDMRSSIVGCDLVGVEGIVSSAWKAEHHRVGPVDEVL